MKYVCCGALHRWGDACTVVLIYPNYLTRGTSLRADSFEKYLISLSPAICDASSRAPVSFYCGTRDTCIRVRVRTHARTHALLDPAVLSGRNIFELATRNRRAVNIHRSMPRALGGESRYEEVPAELINPGSGDWLLYTCGARARARARVCACVRARLCNAAARELFKSYRMPCGH